MVDCERGGHGAEGLLDKVAAGGRLPLASLTILSFVRAWGHLIPRAVQITWLRATRSE